MAVVEDLIEAAKGWRLDSTSYRTMYQEILADPQCDGLDVYIRMAQLNSRT